MDVEARLTLHASPEWSGIRDLGFRTHELLWVLAGPAAAVADRAAASSAVPGFFVTGFLTLLYGLPSFFHFLPPALLTFQCYVSWYVTSYELAPNHVTQSGSKGIYIPCFAALLNHQSSAS